MSYNVLTKAQAKKLIETGKAAQVTVMYQAQTDTTYGVLNNYEECTTQHYPIGTGDLRDDVPETTPALNEQ